MYPCGTSITQVHLTAFTERIPYRRGPRVLSRRGEQGCLVRRCSSRHFSSPMFLYEQNDDTGRSIPCNTAINNSSNILAKWYQIKSNQSQISPQFSQVGFYLAPSLSIGFPKMGEECIKKISNSRHDLAAFEKKFYCSVILGINSWSRPSQSGLMLSLCNNNPQDFSAEFFAC